MIGNGGRVPCTQGGCAHKWGLDAAKGALTKDAVVTWALALQRLAIDWPKRKAEDAAAQRAKWAAAVAVQDVGRLRDAICDQLKLNCPQCDLVYVDHDACNSLECPKCGVGFCAVCLQVCGAGKGPVHAHIRSSAFCGPDYHNRPLYLRERRKRYFARIVAAVVSIAPLGVALQRAVVAELGKADLAPHEITPQEVLDAAGVKDAGAPGAWACAACTAFNAEGAQACVVCASKRRAAHRHALAKGVWPAASLRRCDVCGVHGEGAAFFSCAPCAWDECSACFHSGASAQLKPRAPAAPPPRAAHAHALTLGARTGARRCDVCRAANGAGAGFWSCRACDYDECISCFSAGPARSNDEGHAMRPGSGACAGTLYCGRRLGVAAIPGSDGQCGPSNGPQCASCKRAAPRAAHAHPLVKGARPGASTPRCDVCRARGAGGGFFTCVACNYDECEGCFRSGPSRRGASPAALTPGTRVVRGPSWQWADQDGGAGQVGVASLDPDEGWVKVTWPSGKRFCYRYDPGRGVCDVVPVGGAAVPATAAASRRPTLGDRVILSPAYSGAGGCLGGRGDGRVGKVIADDRDHQPFKVECRGLTHWYAERDVVLASGGRRPTVGDRVRLHPLARTDPLFASWSLGAPAEGRVGVVVVDDESSVPFKVDVGGATSWYSEGFVVLAG